MSHSTLPTPHATAILPHASGEKMFTFVFYFAAFENYETMCGFEYFMSVENSGWLAYRNTFSIPQQIFFSCFPIHWLWRQTHQMFIASQVNHENIVFIAGCYGMASEWGFVFGVPHIRQKGSPELLGLHLIWSFEWRLSNWRQYWRSVWSPEMTNFHTLVCIRNWDLAIQNFNYPE